MSDWLISKRCMSVIYELFFLERLLRPSILPVSLQNCSVMSALKGLVLLAVCIQVSQQASAHNDAPCQLNKNNNAHNIFLHRHNPSGSPTTLDKKQWQEFIEKQKLCGRPIQSFIRHEEHDKLIAVCSATGGKVYDKNLCISKEMFSFVTVTANETSCEVKEVTKEEKHLILACDKVDNKCVPVHFKPNKDHTPKNYPRDCKA